MEKEEHMLADWIRYCFGCSLAGVTGEDKGEIKERKKKGMYLVHIGGGAKMPNGEVTHSTLKKHLYI